jgi:hypothetical protein
MKQKKPTMNEMQGLKKPSSCEIALERDLQRSENNEESCWETASIRA